MGDCQAPQRCHNNKAVGFYLVECQLYGPALKQTAVPDSETICETQCYLTKCYILSFTCKRNKNWIANVITFRKLLKS